MKEEIDKLTVLAKEFRADGGKLQLQLAGALFTLAGCLEEKMIGKPEMHDRAHNFLNSMVNEHALQQKRRR